MGGKLPDPLMQEPHGKSNLHYEYGASLTSLLPGQRLSGEEQSSLSELCAVSYLFFTVLDPKVTLSSSGAVGHTYQELTWSLTGC